MNNVYSTMWDNKNCNKTKCNNIIMKYNISTSYLTLTITSMLIMK